MAQTPASESHQRTRIFISYSHDSTDHEERVLDLAKRLIAEGVDTHLDSFEESPPEGWPAWMVRQVRDARFVLVVCTKLYHDRVMGLERMGVGLGAKWEGSLITQELYEKGGENHKFIPLVFDDAAVRHIPDFLKHATRYDVSTPVGYDRLYGRLTGQPRVTRPPLGDVRKLSPKTNPVQVPAVPINGARDYVAIMERRGSGVRVIPLERARSGEIIELVLRPEDPSDRAYLEELVDDRIGRRQVGIALGLTAYWGSIRSVTHLREHGHDLFTMEFATSDLRGDPMEMGTSNLSADDIAELRARRILLDERPPTVSKWDAVKRDSMLESLVRGMGTDLTVEHSPLPLLHKHIGGDSTDRFVAAARLAAVLWLRLTGTVDRILELDMRMTSDTTLSVRFRGQRSKIYTNRDPIEIRFEGTCELGTSLNGST